MVTGVVHVLQSQISFDTKYNKLVGVDRTYGSENIDNWQIIKYRNWMLKNKEHQKIKVKPPKL